MVNGSAVLIIGESGSGKSTGMRTLDPKSTFVINVIGKTLPFQGWADLYKPFSQETPTGNYLVSDDTTLILKIIDYVSEKRPEIKTLIIDDTQYIMANEFMRKADVKGYEKFTKIGKDAWQLANKYKSIRPDLILVFLTHAEEFTDLEGNRRLKAKTVGELICPYLLNSVNPKFLMEYGNTEPSKEFKSSWACVTTIPQKGSKVLN